jgi:glutamate synthase (NADPH) large chain
MTGGRVVVLGRTGRNFGAGMSGGFAYVLDESGDFEKLCNTEMVELEELGADDAAFVAGMIEEHRARTGSIKSGQLLTNWEQTVQRLIKVFPMEYRRALEEQQELKNNGPQRPSMIPAMQAEPKSGVIAGG